MYDKEKSRIAILDLCNRFQSHILEYKSQGYLESQLRMDFINELFIILGWDISNKANLSPFNREVLVEKGETKGRPDYSFRINGEDCFFVEAKSVSRGTEKQEDIFQAKKYGWNTENVNIIVLTDFSNFKVFDSSLKPNIFQPNVGLLFNLEFSKYASSDFNNLMLFSHEDVINGSLNRLSYKAPIAKRLRIPINVAFFEQMTIWREQIAKDVYKKNPEMNVRTLNDVVQKILDRFIFIRILEDRKIIEAKTLKEIADEWKEAKHRDIIYSLNKLFNQLNDDFNGEIFKHHECENTIFDSKTLSDIIESLYSPKSPYDFAVIGVELLGTIYEKFLGKTIRLTEKRVHVEDKFEVRKSGGVFYTPKWVVRYIIENTVGKLIEDKDPLIIENIRILDPACGSGSFLIAALELLFEHHLNYYIANSKEAKRGTLFPNLIIESDSDGNKINRLSIEKKGEILRNNIFGVDLDPQAVEITMMSLYIKVLEGEKTLPHNKELLPSLANNIHCGNSLVGFDFNTQTTLVDDPEKDRANPFEWSSKSTGFGKILDEHNGFDIIIGNPPYIRIQTMNEITPKIVEYLSKKYITAKNNNYDIYVVFVEKAIELLAPNGIFGFILPNKFFHAEYGMNLRSFISEKKILTEIVNFMDQQVFDEATTYTCLLFLNKSPQNEFKYAEILKLDNPSTQLALIKINEKFENEYIRIGKILTNTISLNPWQFSLGKEGTLFNKLKIIDRKLGDIASSIFVGLQTSADPVYILKRNNPFREGKLIEVFSKSLDKVVEMEAEMLKPILKGEEIHRYSVPDWKYYVIFPYYLEGAKAIPFSKDKLEKYYPKTWNYLLENRKKLQSRDKGDRMGDQWFTYVYPKNLIEFSEPKIMTQVLANRASFTIDEKGVYYFVGGGNAGGYGIKLKSTYDLDPKYITGLLNSKLLDFYLKKISSRFRQGYFSYAKRFIEQLPIKIPNLKDDKENEYYNGIIQYVQKILELNKRMNGLNDKIVIDRIQREIMVYNEKIDEIVYKIYDISNDEIRIIG